MNSLKHYSFHATIEGRVRHARMGKWESPHERPASRNATGRSETETRAIKWPREQNPLGKHRRKNNKREQQRKSPRSRTSPNRKKSLPRRAQGWGGRNRTKTRRTEKKLISKKASWLNKTELERQRVHVSVKDKAPGKRHLDLNTGLTHQRLILRRGKNAPSASKDRNQLTKVRDRPSLDATKIEKISEQKLIDEK